MATAPWHPTWWNDSDVSAWDRVKDALRRDWEQTKFDLKVGDGTPLNQDASDTVKQALGKEPIPPPNQPNPLKVRGGWEAVEHPIAYGYSAHRYYGVDHPEWNDTLEQKLRAEWETGQRAPDQAWDNTRDMVRYGYSYKSRSSS